MKLKEFVIGLMAGFAIAGSAQASIVDHGNYLSDTTSKLDWLDVTLTTNLSFNQVSQYINSNATYNGVALGAWRFATGSEFNELAKNATGTPFPPNWTGNVPHAEGPIDALVGMLGSTLDVYNVATFGVTFDSSRGKAEGAVLDYAMGLIADREQNNRWLALVEDDDAYQNPWFPDSTQAYYLPVSSDEAKLYFGSFLVRNSVNEPPSSVPEPISFALLGAGLLGVWATRRKSIVL